MAYFHTTVLDNQIKALPTVSTASGSVATFDTDMTENLVKCVLTLPYFASGYNGVSVSVGDNINLWNEMWEIGNISDSTGEDIIATDRIRSYWFKVEGLTSAYFEHPQLGRIFLYDENRQFISATGWSNRRVETVSGATWCRFVMSASYGTTYNGDISFNNPSSNTNYNAFNGIQTYFDSVIYGGSIDMITGIITSAYNPDGTEKVTPDKIRGKGCEIITIDNDTNTIYNMYGDTSVKYILSVGKAIS